MDFIRVLPFWIYVYFFVLIQKYLIEPEATVVKVILVVSLLIQIVVFWFLTGRGFLDATEIGLLFLAESITVFVIYGFLWIGANYISEELFRPFLLLFFPAFTS